MRSSQILHVLLKFELGQGERPIDAHLEPLRLERRVEVMSSNRSRAILYLVLLGAVLGVTIKTSAAQDSTQEPQTRARRVTRATSLRTIPNGESVGITGNVIRIDDESFSVCDFNGAETVVAVTHKTKFSTHRRGIFRGAKSHEKSSLMIGLRVEVKGRGNAAGQLEAKTVHFHDSDFRAQTEIETRAIPIEAEQVRQAAQLEETTGVANTALKNAKTAQDSADRAQGTADTARNEAATAQTTADAAHAKIAAIDDFETTEVLTVNFRAGSAKLTADTRARLDEFAAKTVNEKGFVIELSGYASKEGTEYYNHELSGRRAEAVLDYLVGVCKVPLRRIVGPHSGGTTNPVADNRTREGREQNRRVEVKLLFSKGLASKDHVAVKPQR